MLSNRPYKGTRDFFPKDKRLLDYIYNNIKNVLLSFGFEAYDGPILEDTELYRAKSGNEIVNDQMYHFVDKGNRSVAIRPEMTPTLARMISQVVREQPLPFRWFSFPNLMRFEKPQRGRLREHWQLNCDIYGAPEIWGEAEIFSILIKIMKSFGATSQQFKLLINDKKMVEIFFKTVLNLNTEQIQQTYKFLDKYKKINNEARDKMLSEISLNSEQEKIFNEYLALSSFNNLNLFLHKYNIEQNCENLIQFNHVINELEISEYLTYDPTIVRGLDYYTGIVFELFDTNKKNPRAICGGGRYDNLLEIFNGPNVSGIGFGMGDVTLSDFLETHGLLPNFDSNIIDALVTFQTQEAEAISFKVAENLRSHGLNVEYVFNCIKIKKAFNMAQKKTAKYIVLIGDDELSKSLVTIKNLETREQKSLSLSLIKDFIK
jgi:histidyl-tRNA synthetase